MASWWFCFVSAMVIISLSSRVECQGQMPYPALFIFGDSLVDAGNNNYITTIAKANSLPFGIDFPGGPSGRFTNGKTVVDVTAEIINLPFPPPYLAPTTRGPAILKGVNYASAAAGYLRSTGFNFVGRVDFDTQLSWFSNTIQQLHELIGVAQTQDLLAKSLVATVFGSNDYVNNYLLSYSPLNKEYTPTSYREVVLQKSAQQLTRLYELGARMVAVSGVGPLGCIPSQLVRQKSVNGECSKYVNDLSQDFNAGLIEVINELNAKLPGAKFVYADTFTPVLEYVNNPQKYGFNYTTTACCGAGKYNGQALCFPFIKPCPDRRIYIFFDAFHPTEAANQFLAQTLYNNLKSNIGNNN